MSTTFVNHATNTSTASPGADHRRQQLLRDFTECHPHIHLFRFYWEDLTGTSRVRIVTRSHVIQLMESGRFIGIGASVLSMIQDSSLNGSPELGHVGQWSLVPDFNSLRLWTLTGMTRYASVMCSFAQLDGAPVALCPQTVLSRILRTAQDLTPSLSLKLGFEIEFNILPLPQDDDLATATNTTSNTSKQNAPFPRVHTWAGARALSGRPLEILEDVVQSLTAAGIEVQHFEAEGGSSQFEIATGPLPPLEAVQTLLHSREIIRNACDLHAATATFHPKINPAASGAGAHVHFSFVHEPDSSLGDAENIASANVITESPPQPSPPSTQTTAASAQHKSFIAGILAHLPAICAFTVPTVVSYDRLKDGGWAGGTWVAWGTQNRETPLRRIDDDHWEFKTLDGTANMYLAIAALVAGGVLGVREGLRLKGEDCLEDPALLHPAQRAHHGITTRLPSSLPAALAALRADAPLREILGEGLLREYFLVKEREIFVVEGRGPGCEQGVEPGNGDGQNGTGMVVGKGKDWYRRWY